MLRASVIQRGWMYGVLLFIAVVVVAVIICLYLMRSKSVVYKFVESGTPGGRPVISIFNPFRDRQPENCAAAFLESMKAGQCEHLMAGLAVDMEYRQYICKQERTNALMVWNLKGREDSLRKVKLYYFVGRRHYAGAEGQLWVTVEERDSQWQVTNYECWY
jgi:hypothetical protein